MKVKATVSVLSLCAVAAAAEPSSYEVVSARRLRGMETPAVISEALPIKKPKSVTKEGGATRDGKNRDGLRVSKKESSGVPKLPKVEHILKSGDRDILKGGLRSLKSDRPALFKDKPALFEGKMGSVWKLSDKFGGKTGGKLDGKVDLKIGDKFEGKLGKTKFGDRKGSLRKPVEDFPIGKKFAGSKRGRRSRRKPAGGENKLTFGKLKSGKFDSDRPKTGKLGDGKLEGGRLTDRFGGAKLDGVKLGSAGSSSGKGPKLGNKRTWSDKLFAGRSSRQHRTQKPLFGRRLATSRRVVRRKGPLGAKTVKRTTIHKGKNRGVADTFKNDVKSILLDTVTDMNRVQRKIRTVPLIRRLEQIDLVDTIDVNLSDKPSPDDEIVERFKESFGGILENFSGGGRKQRLINLFLRICKWQAKENKELDPNCPVDETEESSPEQPTPEEPTPEEPTPEEPISEDNLLPTIEEQGPDEQPTGVEKPSQPEDTIVLPDGFYVPEGNSETVTVEVIESAIVQSPAGSPVFVGREEAGLSANIVEMLGMLENMSIAGVRDTLVARTNPSEEDKAALEIFDSAVRSVASKIGS